MILSPTQQHAHSCVRDWLRDWKPGTSQPYFYLAGYAGTGKTTIARVLADDVNRVCFASFTGKAAHVMRSKGCEGASTIHSLIYSYMDDDETGKPTFGLNPNSDIVGADLVVIDECSMVGRDIGWDLLSFKHPVLVLGDPAQLPPVDSAGFFTGGTPDYMLTEVRRQDLESPILRLATSVRQGEPVPMSTEPACRVMRKAEVEPESWSTHDQIIVGTNAMRRAINARVRERMGINGWIPRESERVICLRNSRELGLFNGQMWDVSSCEEVGSGLKLGVTSDGRSVECEAHREHFMGREVEQTKKRNAEEFDFAYAVTGHKSQGSEWSSVLAFDQSHVFGADARRWLYTIVTRAADRLTLLV